MTSVPKSDNVLEQNPAKKKIYNKSESFETFVSNIGVVIENQRRRAVTSLEAYLNDAQGTQRVGILKEVLRNLTHADPGQAEFKLTTMIADELSKTDDTNLPRYLYHRYRYDVFPKKKILDDYPPYLQIEPTSVCNYRCVFCYQSDEAFTKKTSGHMGMMSLGLFKEAIDQIEGNVEFLSLASRGEPLICRDIDKMLEYCVGKFLGFKVNTNASLLTEKLCHAILAGGVNTIVFSADAAEEPLYSRLRVNGHLEKVLNNIRLFHAIRNKHYPRARIISRVSGVKFNDEQNMPSMLNLWGGLVDQISFVAYNPWENVYASAVSGVEKPCSDLWRRMFVWYDGKVNPCDTDYKSTLSVGTIQEKDIAQLWRSDAYQRLRDRHVQGLRGETEPCRRCTVI